MCMFSTHWPTAARRACACSLRIAWTTDRDCYLLAYHAQKLAEAAGAKALGKKGQQPSKKKKQQADEDEDEEDVMPGDDGIIDEPVDSSGEDLDDLEHALQEGSGLAGSEDNEEDEEEDGGEEDAAAQLQQEQRGKKHKVRRRHRRGTGCCCCCGRCCGCCHRWAGC